MKFWVDRLENEKGISEEVVIDSLEELMAFFAEEGDFLITHGDAGRPGFVVYGDYDANVAESRDPWGELGIPEDLEYDMDVKELE